MSQSIYTGPGKAYMNAKAFQPQNENGELNVAIDERTTQVRNAMFGYQAESTEDVNAKVSLVPFDSWGLLPVLFPAFLGVTCGATTGALAIGTRAHDAAAGSANANNAVKVWTPDGRLYNFVRGAITKHPEVYFGTGKELFGGMEITCLGDVTKRPGDSGYLVAGNAITETGAADPGGAFSLTDFIRGYWTAAWGTGAGFGGDGGSPMEAEDFWTLVPEVKYNEPLQQKIKRHMPLASSRFMLKGKIFGPTHSLLMAAVLGKASGYRNASGAAGADLLLSGPSSKTVTLKQCEVKGAGFKFGGTTLNTGEFGFVSQSMFTAGAPQPQLIFSA
jgi:hypothetical protein